MPEWQKTELLEKKLVSERSTGWIGVSDQECSAFAENFTGQCHPYTVMDKHNVKMNVGTMPEEFSEQTTHRGNARTYIK